MIKPQSQGQENKIGVVESREIIPECCRQRISAVVLSTLLTDLSRVRFQSLHGSVIRFRVEDDAVYRIQSMFVISFSYNNRSYVFLSNVLDFFQEGVVTFVEFEVPHHITAAEYRSTFRVPIIEECEFQVTVLRNGKSVKAQAEDISLSGILLNFDQSKDVPDVDENVLLRMRSHEHDIEILGTSAAEPTINVAFSSQTR